MSSLSDKKSVNASDRFPLIILLTALDGILPPGTFSAPTRAVPKTPASIALGSPSDTPVSKFFPAEDIAAGTFRKSNKLKSPSTGRAAGPRAARAALSPLEKKLDNKSLRPSKPSLDS